MIHEQLRTVFGGILASAKDQSGPGGPGEILGRSRHRIPSTWREHRRPQPFGDREASETLGEVHDGFDDMLVLGLLTSRERIRYRS